MNTTPTRFTEIGMIVLAALLIIGGVFLIFFGKISFVEFSPFLVAVLGLFGINVAWKAPSPAQAQQLSAHADQLNNQQQQIASVQELALRAANTATQVQAQVQAPVQLQPINLAGTASPQLQFMQPAPPPVMVDYNRHFGDSQVMPVVEMQTQKIPAA